MQKSIVITGASDGIGLATTKMLLDQGHRVLMHGRNPQKLADAAASLDAEGANTEQYIADLSELKNVVQLAKDISAKHSKIDVLINNAGVLKTKQTRTGDGLDIRFAVNTIAPFLLTEKLLPLLGSNSRVVNVSSAAAAPVDLAGLAGDKTFDNAMDAYSQSKLAITMWTRSMAALAGNENTVFVSVNPGSLLASKMVKEGFGIAGSDINIGADILCRAALSEEFANVSGQYYDNDAKRFADPHTDALDDATVKAVVTKIEHIVSQAM
jgi:NAD(P)-dependent dehydrogenase (short-subunit alcohol dehydrogenase family)